MLTPPTKILKCLCVGRATGRQAHVDDYHLCKQTLKECDNNWISSQSQHFLGSVSEPICGYTSGWKGNHSHRWSCSSFTTPATFLVSWKPCDQIRGDFGSSQRRLKTLLCWNRLLGAYKDKRNKYQPATVFVALNIPPVRSDFPNLAMRAILEWTPGRAWRQSGKRELHSNDFKPLWKKNENIQRSAFHEDPVRPPFWHETIFCKYIESVTVNSQWTNRIAVFSAEKEVHIVKWLTSLVLTSLFSQQTSTSRCIHERPWTGHKTWKLKKRRWGWTIPNLWCQRMLKIKCSPDVSDPPVYKKKKKI